MVLNKLRARVRVIINNITSRSRSSYRWLVHDKSKRTKMAANLSSSSPPTSPRHTANFSKMGEWHAVYFCVLASTIPLFFVSLLGSWDAEEDTQNLFQKHSVVEIRELEKRARFVHCFLPYRAVQFEEWQKSIQVRFLVHSRGDIERKKEELRLMVG